jgi:hypothetical protein
MVEPRQRAPQPVVYPEKPGAGQERKSAS